MEIVEKNCIWWLSFNHRVFIVMKNKFVLFAVFFLRNSSLRVLDRFNGTKLSIVRDSIEYVKFPILTGLTWELQPKTSHFERRLIPSSGPCIDWDDKDLKHQPTKQLLLKVRFLLR